MRGEKGGCTMKQGKLIRRAVSAALAGCMMFTFSAPALAESTDALMQLSISGNRAASVLDAENGAEEIKINNEVINPADYDNIVINNKYTFRYDPVQKVLTSTSTIPINAITIKVPDDVDVVLDGKEHIAVNNLTINGAHDVMISSDNDPAIGSKAKITCTGKVTIDAPGANFAIGATNSSTSDGLLTISGASEVEINAPNSSRILGGFYSKADITCDGPVTIRGNVDGGSTLAKSFTYNRTDGAGYVYFTSEDEEEGAIDASVTPLVQDGKYTYLRIEEKQDAHLKVHNGTVTVGDTTSKELDSFKGQKVTVASTIEETEDRKFDGWEVTKAPAGFTISADKLKQKKFSFIMPTGNVELTAHHSNKLEVSGGTAAVNGNAVDFARPKADVRVTATDLSAKGYQFDHWVVSSGDIGKTGDELKANPLDFTMPDEAVKLTAVYRAAVTVVNGIAEAGTESGETIFVLQGEKVTVSGKNRNPDVTKFGGWKVISPEGFELTEEQKNTEESMTFTMPASPVELKASYSFPAPVLDMQVTVKGGTIRVGEGESQTGTVFVQPGQTVTIEADEPAKENESFHHWKVEKGSASFAPTAGSLGSATEAGTAEISFDMPNGNVNLTAVYSIPASVLRSTVTVTGGTAKSTLGEGSDIPAEIGTEVEITATPYDAEKYPGMEFVEWEIKYPDSFYEKFPDGIPENLQLKLDNAKSAATTFKMPVYPVKLIAHWSASAVAGPDEPIDEDFGVEPAPMDTTGGTIAAVAVGGAAIWGGYEIATRVILHNLLPEGAAIPANRGQLALLIWTEKGKPEPAAQPAFADITDAELAKAAQWCVEQGLLDAREGKFESDGWMPKFKTIEIWNKAFPKK